MDCRHFILIGNYAPDRQESMLRFTELLASGLRSQGITVEILAPQRVLAGKGANPAKGFWKWSAYVDKWILFPFSLRRAVRKGQRKFGDSIRFHICDHSNAPYLAHLPEDRTGITCHDVLAIRGALGYPEAYCPASRMGVILQRWILKHLRQARRIVCVSQLTRQHLCEVAGESAPKRDWIVVPNALNADFKKVESSQATRILERQGYHLPKPFLLHVGSNLPRKNRAMLLQMIKLAGQQWQGDICFAGESMDDLLASEARRLGILERIHSVPKPDHQTLCALYSLCHVFVFPSFSEGFGWPVTEAQACGAPVIASSLEPLPEISGGAAIHADPHDAPSFVEALLALNDGSIRQSLIAQGFKNATRFGRSPMVESYLSLHGLHDPPGACSQR